MGRPNHGAMSSFSGSLIQRIEQMRKQHRGWGPTTILAELKYEGQWSQEELPSRSTIGRLLQQQKWSRTYEPNVALPVEDCTKAKRCHSLWQVDGQGNSSVAGIGTIAMLNIKDVFSSLYVCSFPARMKSKHGHPCTSDYQTAMRLGFVHHGLPKRLQSDHASVFYENKSKSPFPTLFCLWLVSLGIEPCFSRVHMPTDQAKVEKAHQTLFDQVLYRREDYQNWEQLFEQTQLRRSRLNEVIPSTATDNQPPLEKYPKAKHSGRFYHLHQEAKLINLNRVYNFLAKGKWYRKVASSRTVSLGRQVYYISGAKPREQLLITFRKKDQHLVFQNDKELVLTTLPIKGISCESLMGDLEQTAQFPNFQLELPLYWEAQKLNTTFSDST
jgi:transposase InsO family protein